MIQQAGARESKPSKRRQLVRRIRNIFSRNPKSLHNAALVQSAELAFYESWIQPGMTVFDVGSNVGKTAEFFIRKTGTTGAVHCFEPGGRAFSKLQERFAFADSNAVKLNNIAVGNENGLTEFHIYPESHSSWNSMKRRPLENYGIDIEPVEVISVPVITLDTYCSNHSINRIDLLKLDLEGGELQALQGAKGLFLDRKVLACILEFGQTTFDQGNTPEMIKSFFDGVGYPLRNLIDGDPTFPGGRSVDTAQYAMLLATKN
jgi:FkbM family methyltransferase